MTPKKASINKEENKSPVKSSRKSLLKLSQKDEKMTSSKNNIIEEVENVTSINNKKRSLRKSVAFDGKNLQTYICYYKYTFQDTYRCTCIIVFCYNRNLRGMR